MKLLTTYETKHLEIGLPFTLTPLSSKSAYLFDPIGPTQLAWTLFPRMDRKKSAFLRVSSQHCFMNHSETHRRIIYGHDYDSAIDGTSTHSILMSTIVWDI